MLVTGVGSLSLTHLSFTLTLLRALRSAPESRLSKSDLLAPTERVVLVG